jgi:arsenate reductase
VAIPLVLVLCTGNSARSQMAEALLRAKAANHFEAASAGTDPAERVHPLAVAAMREAGVDIGTARPKDVREFLGHAPVRHLITVCHDADQRCPSVWPGILTRDHWPIEDPAAFRGEAVEALARFRRVRDELSRRLDAWLVAHRPVEMPPAR